MSGQASVDQERGEKRDARGGNDGGLLILPMRMGITPTGDKARNSPTRGACMAARGSPHAAALAAYSTRLGDRPAIKRPQTEQHRNHRVSPGWRNAMLTCLPGCRRTRPPVPDAHR